MNKSKIFIPTYIKDPNKKATTFGILLILFVLILGIVEKL